MVFSKPAYILIRIGLGMIFVVSGILKLSDLTAFAEIIHAYAILPMGLTPPAAFIISFSELLLGIGLIIDIKGSLAGILGLLVMFMAVLGWAIYMGYDIDCGCFGPDDPEHKAFSHVKTAFARDGLMVAAVAYLYTCRRKLWVPARNKTV